nr:hypothetical protein [Cystobacter fuscus]
MTRVEVRGKLAQRRAMPWGERVPLLEEGCSFEMLEEQQEPRIEGHIRDVSLGSYLVVELDDLSWRAPEAAGCVDDSQPPALHFQEGNPSGVPILARVEPLGKRILLQTVPLTKDVFERDEADSQIDL